MKRLSRLRFNSDVAVHVIGDALMVSVALLISLIICYLSMIDIQGNVVSVRSILQVPFGLYARRSWLLTLISLIVFYLSGLYTHGQVYRDRHKVLVLARAVTLSYLIFGFLSFLSPASISLPRSILLLAWFLTMAFVIGARAWSMLWHAIAQKEGGPFPTGHTDSEIMDVLVIGGAGCIGSALVERLKSEAKRS